MNMDALRVRGPAWRFGDDVDTDQIVPGRYLDASSEEQSRHVFETSCPEFLKEFRVGTILVAGSNFGCGSSRESAAEVLQHLGVAAVVAASFARIFFRNAIAIGLAVLECPAASENVRKGDEIEVDLESAHVTNVSTGASYRGTSLNEMMLASLRRGGLLKLLVDP